MFRSATRSLVDLLGKVGAGLELHDVLGGDLDLLAGGRVQTLAGSAALGAEGAEAEDADLAAGVQLDRDDSLAILGREDVIDDLSSLGLSFRRWTLCIRG